MELVLANDVVCIIDDNLYNYLNQWRWRAGTHGYVQRSKYKKRVEGIQKTTTVLLHRFVWELHNGAIPDNMEIDHINQDKLDNRIENLRAVTKLENLDNVKRNNVTGYRYVYYQEYSCGGGYSSKREKPYRARVRVGGKRISLGWFKTAQEAHKKVEEYLSSVKS